MSPSAFVRWGLGSIWRKVAVSTSNGEMWRMQSRRTRVNVHSLPWWLLRPETGNKRASVRGLAAAEGGMERPKWHWRSSETLDRKSILYFSLLISMQTASIRFVVRQTCRFQVPNKFEEYFLVIKLSEMNLWRTFFDAESHLATHPPSSSAMTLRRHAKKDQQT